MNTRFDGITIESAHVKDAVKTAVALSLLLAVQSFGMHQYVTGTLVNMGLLVTAMMVGRYYGMFVGFATPMTALAFGILPPPLAGMVPFIGVGNALYVLGFDLLRRRSAPLGLALGTVVKVGLLSTAVRFVVTVPAPVVVMMQWPQVYTAITGGLLALAIVGVVRRSARS